MAKYEEFAEEFKIITGHHMKLNSLANRIIAEKIGYLLYRKNINSSYTDFSWHLHGVLSWDLWYDIINFWNPKSILLPPKRVETLMKIKKDFNEAGITKYFDKSDNLELITTVLYCAEKQEDLSEHNNNLIKKVSLLKHKFGESDIKNAINVIAKIKWRFKRAIN